MFGLWFADGWIYKNTFAIALTKKDSPLLRNVLEKMGSTYPIYYREINNCSYFQISSKKIVKNIIKLGGSTRKSLTARFPNIPKRYLASFVRGYFDGDGSISCTKTGNKLASSFKKKYRINFTSGSFRFLKELKRSLQNNIPGLTCYISKYLPRNFVIRGKQYAGKHNYYILNLAANATLLLGKYMYKNPRYIKMERKYKKFIELENMRKNHVETKTV